MKTLSLLTIAALLAAPAFAAEPIFASPAQTHAQLILAAPPSADSAITRAELAELHRIQSSRTSAEEAQAKADEADESLYIYKTVLGEKFTPEALPLTTAFGKRVKNDEGANAGPAKQAFKRVRPYNLDKTLAPICKTKTIDDSYPSGHATAGYLAALTLIEMVPDQRDAILARADGYARSRLVCGVHYPSDIAASKLLAYTTHAVMVTNPKYQSELAAAKVELRRQLGLPAAD
ncbi:phosphatase PAP2 family protein [Duganella sp. FT80W]|uniref:Acid phosphatase n=1 Tax=Duganella guangzhouensis TaxID=2666084 RepID=A0A6I2KVG3_9BURK|nr:phosphatase PAP2 family protein [Duganella guangzhouensis]MRW89928.1 phosphatase PAP2 family protein [Duganella guangzhouensis]